MMIKVWQRKAGEKGETICQALPEGKEQQISYCDTIA
jgi:hypothetical protein